MSFAGQVVWVTGASAGIGEALARSFAARGARLVLSARRAERLEALRAGLPAPGPGAEAIVRAVERGRDEVLIGGREVWAVRLHRFLPGLFRRLIRTAKVT